MNSREFQFICQKHWNNIRNASVWPLGQVGGILLGHCINGADAVKESEIGKTCTVRAELLIGEGPTWSNVVLWLSLTPSRVSLLQSAEFSYWLGHTAQPNPFTVSVQISFSIILTHDPVTSWILLLFYMNSKVKKCEDVAEKLDAWCWTEGSICLVGMSILFSYVFSALVSSKDLIH